MADHENFFRVAINTSIGDQPMTNVFHVNREGADAAEVCEDVAHFFAADFGAILSTGVDWGICDAKEMTGTALEALYDMSAETGGNGNNAETPMAPGVALVVTWVTAAGGRSHRGRSYISGVAHDYADSPPARWDSAEADLQTAVNNFLGDCAARGDFLQVYSRTLDSFSVVTEGIRKLNFGSQRRRNTP